MARRWDELSDEEQKSAVSALHAARRDWRAMYPTHVELELVEIAINHVDASRRRYSGGMTNYGAGVVVLLFNNKGEILVGKRKGSHGAGTWSLPGGKLEFKKSAIEQVQTELEEETGIKLALRDFRVREWVDTIWEDKDKGLQHWVTLFTQARYESWHASPRIMEPDKCEEWRFASPEEIRTKLPTFYPLTTYIRTYGLEERIYE